MTRLPVVHLGVLFAFAASAALGVPSAWARSPRGAASAASAEGTVPTRSGTKPPPASDAPATPTRSAPKPPPAPPPPATAPAAAKPPGPPPASTPQPATPLPTRTGSAPPAQPATPAPPATPPLNRGPRIAIDEFKVEGDDVPSTLVLQLLDGFVLGLVRDGLEVVDPDDTTRRLATSPDLVGCDTSPCLKRKGQILGVRFLARAKVDVAGNSYKMSMRIYGTEGAAPAVLPLETRSRFCDVCTVAEAREVMMRLTDGIDFPREEVIIAPKPAPAPPPPPPSRTWPGVGLAAGLAAIVAGTIILATSGDDAKGAHAFAGGLMGAGALGTSLALYGLLEPPASATRASGAGAAGLRGTTVGVGATLGF